MKNYNRTFVFTVIVGTIIIVGCNPVMTPLKGQYGTAPVEITSTKTADTIWSDLTNLFVANGLGVHDIDKKKGLLTTTETSFIPVYTFEDENGQLQQRNAWVLLRKVSLNKKEWKVTRIHSQWQIQISSTGKDLTRIKVDPVVVCTYWPNSVTRSEMHGQSTGKFEELIKASLVNDRK